MILRRVSREIALAMAIFLTFGGELSLWGAVATTNVSSRTVWLRVRDQYGAACPTSGVRFTQYPIPELNPHNTYARTDSNGRAKVGLFDGMQYRIRCSPAINEPYEYTGVVRIQPDIGKTETSPLEIEARKTDLQIKGRVLASGGKGVPDARIVAFECSEDTVTSADGSFSLYLLRAPNPLVLKAYRDGYLFEERPVESNEVLNVIYRGELDPRLKVFMQVQVGGTNVDFTGPVCLGLPPPSTEREQVGYVAHGEGFARIQQGRYRPYSEELEGQKGLRIVAEDTVVLPGTTNLVFQAEPIPRARLWVKETGTSNVVTNAVVVLGGMRMTNEVDGGISFAMKSSVLAHPDLVVRCKGYVTRRLRVTTETNLVVFLERSNTVSIEGVVLDDKGAVVQGAMVSVITNVKGRRTEKMGRTDIAGRFVIEDVTPQPNELLVRKNNFAFHREVINPIEAKSLKISIEPGVSISFQVHVDDKKVKDEKLTDGIVLICSDDMRVCHANIWMRGSGFHGSVQLLPGTYKVVWAGRKWGFIVRDMTVSGAQNISVEIASPEDRTVKPVAELLDMPQ